MLKDLFKNIICLSLEAFELIQNKSYIVIDGLIHSFFFTAYQPYQGYLKLGNIFRQ